MGRRHLRPLKLPEKDLENPHRELDMSKINMVLKRPEHEEHEMTQLRTSRTPSMKSTGAYTHSPHGDARPEVSHASDVKLTLHESGHGYM